jgi:hypothetical protein
MRPPEELTGCPTAATSDRHNLDACIGEGADLLVGRTGIGDQGDVGRQWRPG